VLAGLAPKGAEAPLLRFTPHLRLITRGILSTCYADVRPDTTAEESVIHHRQFYVGAA
jgi:N-acetyl-gamma-glutamylphosphate reductase